MRKLVLVNGKIYVKRGTFAEGVYAEDGIIKAVGTNSEVVKCAGETAEIIDCAGRTVIPGLNDAHMHMLVIGAALVQLKTSDVTSIEDLISRGQKFIAEHPETARFGLQSMGWNEDLFTSGEHRAPNRQELDRISKDIPIILQRVCGHVASVNTKVIEMMGLTGNSPQFPDGTFELDPDGEPNGVLTENAISRAVALMPEIDLQEYEARYVAAANRALSLGVTSVQSNDAGCSEITWDIAFTVANNVRKRQPAPRYHGQFTFHEVDDLRAHLNKGKLDKNFHPQVEIGPLKLFKDGSLGGRTATMRAPYRDDPTNKNNTGVEVLSPAAMDEMCAVARDAGVQIITHAIGDRAIAEAVESYIKADPENKLRNIVNHCQITDRALLERMVQNNICVSYQPIFLDYDMHITESRVGRELASTSYAFGTMAKLGAHVGYGTDAPVEDCNPFPNLYEAITRMDKNYSPEGGWFPDECVDVETAIDAYTVGSAYLEFHENDKGRIQPGFVSDMVILDNDIFTCEPKAIRDILPVMTILDGEVVYKR